MSSNKVKSLPTARNRKRCPRPEVFRHGDEEYSIVHMPPDGNCLFHSLAYCLRQSVAEHLAIRRQAVDYVAANWGLRFGPVLAAFLRDRGRPVDTARGYYDYMVRFGVFGGDPELCAISEIYGVKIKVFVKCHPKNRPHVYNERCRDSICLLFSGTPDNGHYDVALPIHHHQHSPISSHKHDAILSSTIDKAFLYAVMFSTMLILGVTCIAMQLSLATVKY